MEFSVDGLLTQEFVFASDSDAETQKSTNSSLAFNFLASTYVAPGSFLPTPTKEKPKKNLGQR